jgi:hypothetical protein
MFRGIKGFTRTYATKAFLAAAVMGIIPAAAQADRHDDDRRDNGRYERHDAPAYGHHDNGGSVRVGINVGGGSYGRPVYQDCATQVWVEPVYRTVIERTWVPAEYRTVVERVWREPVVRRVNERVWVPDRYEDRDVVRCDMYGRRFVSHERVLCEAAHYAFQDRDVVVTPGHYADCPRQELVCEAHWADVQRPVCVSAGHWETRVERVAVVTPRYDDHARIDLRIPVRW